jgi:hypothetical protein
MNATSDTVSRFLGQVGVWSREQHRRRRPADATADVLDRLKDPSRWIIRRGVPIFTSHIRRDAEGRERYRVTEQDLADIGHNCRRREQGRGVVGLLTIGHRPLDRQVPEADVVKYAKPVGYVVNYRDGTFGPEDTPAVLVDLYYAREHWDEAKQFPFRSAEYWPGRQEITGVALLLRDPELDLGMTHHNRVFYYAMEANMPRDLPDDDDDLLGGLDLPPPGGRGARGSPPAFPDDVPPGRRPPGPPGGGPRGGPPGGGGGGGDDDLDPAFERMFQRCLEKFGVSHKLPSGPTKYGALERAIGSEGMPDRRGYVPPGSVPPGSQGRNEHLRINDTTGEPTDPASPSAAMLVPRDHDEAMQHMRANPGMQYERALLEVRANRGLLEGYRRRAEEGILQFSRRPDPGESPDMVEPYDYEQVMDYMRSHPGMQYDQAKRDCRGGRRGA